MNYLLDTNICVHFFRGKFGVTEKLAAAKVENCAISEITLAELAYGAECSENPEKNHVLIDKLIEIVTIVPIFDFNNDIWKRKVQIKKSGNND